MINHRTKIKSVCSLIVIILITAYILLVFLPHEHDCPGIDCAVCTMIGISKDMLGSAASFTVVPFLAQLILFLLTSNRSAVSFCNGTPVRLKVKLLN